MQRERERKREYSDHNEFIVEFSKRNILPQDPKKGFKNSILVQILQRLFMLI